MIEPLQLITKESPRQIILEDFKIDLPISGYWGYNLESACVIDKNDPAVSKGMPFDGIGIEYIFVEKRIYEEMIIFRDDHEKYAGIRWDRQAQKLLVVVAMTTFDCLNVKLVAINGRHYLIKLRY